MRPRNITVAAVLMVTGWLTHYGYEHVDAKIAAEAWNVGGSLGRVVLLALVVLAWPGAAVAVAALWWCFEEFQVITCTVAWLFQPWPMAENKERCSALVGVPMGLIGAVLLAWVALAISREKKEPDHDE